MSILYIRIPSKAAVDSVADWLSIPCPFAQVLDGGAIGRQGASPLSGLSGTIATAQRVILLLAASDVTLLRVKVPTMSAARLKAALPNLAEDQLITDPADCVFVAGGTSNGLRTVAVVQRSWLDTLAKTMTGFGAQRFAALPAQLCLPISTNQPDCVSAAINEQEAGEQGAGKQDSGIDLILRFAEQEGIGLAIQVNQGGSAAQEIVRTLSAVAPEAPIELYVPQSSVRAYQDAAKQTGAPNERITVLADSWPRWIAGARSTTLDLMAGMGMGVGSGAIIDWRAWRWPLALAAAILVINGAALNFDWWRLSNEAKSLRSTMLQVYKTAYPKETVIIDPIAQMQQKIAAAKRESGLPAADDFTMIASAFGEAWAKVMPSAGMTAPSAISALEYRERSLFVKLKPAGEEKTQQMKTELAKRDLALEPAPEQSGTAVWQIRGAK